MTAAIQTSTVDAVKSYKGGWKDAGLRAAGGRVNLSQPLERQMVSDVWADLERQEACRDDDGHVITENYAFECCSRCGRWSGRFAAIVDGVKGEMTPSVGTRPPCKCPREGQTLLDVDPVPLPELVTGISLGVLVRAGVETTHDAAELGFFALYDTNGIGSKSVDALRAAIVKAGLPELNP